MISGNQALTTLILGLFTLVGIAAMKAPQRDHKNLKVLPSDISDEKLDSIMQSYCKALSVSCSFCHAPVADFPDSLDYASDQLPMKENARKMMRMTIYLNNTYFNFDPAKKPEEIRIVSCITCHHGVAFPPE